MEPASGIRKFGFKRWFERELIESHVYLVTLFLCLTLVIALFEQLGSHPGGFERALIYAAMVAGAAIGVFSWNRYLFFLLRALRLSQRSSCEKCGAYSRFDVLDSARQYREDDPESRDKLWLKVRCKDCGHEWAMT